MQAVREIVLGGDALYDMIYTDFYTGSDVIRDWDSWWPVGGSQICQPGDTGWSYVQITAQSITNKGTDGSVTVCPLFAAAL